MRKVIIGIAWTGVLASAPARAYDFSQHAKITDIELTYAPSYIPFHINKPAGNCKGGAALFWKARGYDAAA